jgi:hypothetical protein
MSIIIMDVLNFAISLFIFLIVVYLYKNKSSFGNKKSKFGKATIATMEGCPHCTPIKEMINKGQIKGDFENLDADKDSEKLSKMGINSFPSIINGNKKFPDNLPRTAENINKFIN